MCEAMHRNPAKGLTSLSIGHVVLILFGASAGVQPLSQASAASARAAQAATTPPFAYRPGPQGVGYYASPAPRATPAPAAGNRPRTVGPRARNWATGNRVPLHRPWMRAKN